MKNIFILLLCILFVPAVAQVTGLDTNMRIAGYRVYDRAIAGDFKKVDSLVVKTSSVRLN